MKKEQKSKIFENLGKNVQNLKIFRKEQVLEQGMYLISYMSIKCKKKKGRMKNGK